jgi:undecaprenyl-diphosphatase
MVRPLHRLLSLLAHSGDIFFVIPFLAILWWFGTERTKTLALVLAAASIVSVAVISGVKFLVRRRRPPGEWGQFYRRTDPYSFPSGHAAKTMTLAAIVVFHGPTWAALALLLWAALVGLARVALGVHYLSDITAGYMGGLIVGVAVSIAVSALGFL